MLTDPSQPSEQQKWCFGVNRLPKKLPVCKVTWCLTSIETIRLIRDGEMGREKIIHLSLHCYHQNDSCIKIGSDESHFNIS